MAARTKTTKARSSTKYLTVGAETTGRLDSRVNSKIDEDWKIQGPLIVVGAAPGQYFYQTMVKGR